MRYIVVKIGQHVAERLQHLINVGKFSKSNFLTSEDKTFNFCENFELGAMQKRGNFVDLNEY